MSRRFECGFFRVRVPAGWLAFYGIDSEGHKSEKKVHIFKDAEAETDIFTHAGITICFFGKEDLYVSPKFFYDNVVDLKPFPLGGYTWQGYTCTSFGYPYTMLETHWDDCVFQVMILTKNGEYEISPEDDDVKAILESLTHINP